MSQRHALPAKLLGSQKTLVAAKLDSELHADDPFYGLLIVTILLDFSLYQGQSPDPMPDTTLTWFFMLSSYSIRHKPHVLRVWGLPFRAFRVCGLVIAISKPERTVVACVVQ